MGNKESFRFDLFHVNYEILEKLLSSLPAIFFYGKQTYHVSYGVNLKTNCQMPEYKVNPRCIQTLTENEP